jgi:hypothetical protein
MGMAKRGIDTAGRVRLAFAGIGPKNPLQRLSSSDKEVLWALLVLYARCTKSTGQIDPWEELSAVLTEAERLSSRIECIERGPNAKIVAPFIVDHQGLGPQLAAFGSQRELLDLIGKAGHKGTIFANQLIVIASEVVRLKTNGPNDEHLADLLQAIDTVSVPESLSATAIAKKRKRLSESYPHIYSFAIDCASRICRSNVPSVAHQ